MPSGSGEKPWQARPGGEAQGRQAAAVALLHCALYVPGGQGCVSHLVFCARGHQAPGGHTKTLGVGVATQVKRLREDDTVGLPVPEPRMERVVVTAGLALPEPRTERVAVAAGLLVTATEALGVDAADCVAVRAGLALAEPGGVAVGRALALALGCREAEAKPKGLPEAEGEARALQLCPADADGGAGDGEGAAEAVCAAVPDVCAALSAHMYSNRRRR